MDREGFDFPLLTVLGPLVLPANLLLLLGSEIVGDIESLPDFIGRLALDHVRNGLASDIEERLDIEIVGGLRSEWLASSSFGQDAVSAARSNERVGGGGSIHTKMISKSIS